MIASPKGGKAPLDPGSIEMFKEDPVSSKFLKEQEALWTNTVKLSDVNVSDFDAIFYVGGHGRKQPPSPPPSPSATNRPQPCTTSTAMPPPWL